MLVRKKVVTLEAWRVSDLLDSVKLGLAKLPPPIQTAYDKGILVFSDMIHVKTLEGVMVADKEDWVICGIRGEFYPCKPDIFKDLYDPLEKVPEISHEKLEETHEKGKKK